MTIKRAVFLDLDSIHPADLDLSGLLGAVEDWDWHSETAPEDTRARIGEAQILITNKVVLDRDALSHARHLKLICTAATGYNNIDIGEAKERGITVSNVRAYATPAVVQHVFSLILTLSTRQREYTEEAINGTWSSAKQFCLLDHPIREIQGLTLGIIGYGELGRGVTQVAEAFGMKVLIAQRPGSSEPSPDRLPLAELLPQVDILSLHCPLTDATRNLIGAEELALMKPDALLINTARGGIVDEIALADALRAGQLGGAGMDTLSVEPPPKDHPLLAADIPKLIITPHTAWASRESRQRLVDQLVENIQAFHSGHPRNQVI